MKAGYYHHMLFRGRNLSVLVLQTWNWTASLVLWPWCGQIAEPRQTRHSSVWVAVLPPASLPGRLFSGWMLKTVPSAEWWGKLLMDGLVVVGGVLLINCHVSLVGYWWCHSLLQWACLYAVGSIQRDAFQSPCCLHIPEVGAWAPSVNLYMSQSWMCCLILYRTKDWFPPSYLPVFDTFGQADLVFHIGIANGECNYFTAVVIFLLKRQYWASNECKW